MTDEVKNQLNELSKVINSVSDLVHHNKGLGKTDSQTLFITYFDIADEHLYSIYTLMFKKYNGSAFALVRTFFDTFFRALWINAFATQEQIKEIWDNNFDFMKDEGKMWEKIEKLDSYYTETDFFKNLKKGVWHTMSDFTHSGTYQLRRRWINNELNPNYKESEILEIIILITKAYLLFANMLFKIHNHQDEENKVLEILIEYKKNTNPILEAIYE